MYTDPVEWYQASPRAVGEEAVATVHVLVVRWELGAEGRVIESSVRSRRGEHAVGVRTHIWRMRRRCAASIRTGAHSCRPSRMTTSLAPRRQPDPTPRHSPRRATPPWPQQKGTRRGRGRARARPRRTRSSGGGSTGTGTWLGWRRGRGVGGGRGDFVAVSCDGDPNGHGDK